LSRKPAFHRDRHTRTGISPPSRLPLHPPIPTDRKDPSC
jgi:hypothetical protein